LENGKSKLEKRKREARRRKAAPTRQIGVGRRGAVSEIGKWKIEIGEEEEKGRAA
jgi:hypothetical protein